MSFSNDWFNNKLDRVLVEDSSVDWPVAFAVVMKTPESLYYHCLVITGVEDPQVLPSIPGVSDEITGVGVQTEKYFAKRISEVPKNQNTIGDLLKVVDLDEFHGHATSKSDKKKFKEMGVNFGGSFGDDFDDALQYSVYEYGSDLHNDYSVLEHQFKLMGFDSPESWSISVVHDPYGFKKWFQLGFRDSDLSPSPELSRWQDISNMPDAPDEDRERRENDLDFDPPGEWDSENDDPGEFE
jgi:hypothetical protein